MFPFTQTDQGVTIFIDGRPVVFHATHQSFPALIEAIDADDEDRVRELADVRRTVTRMTFGRVQILETSILVDGREVSGLLVDRILGMVARGSKAVEGYVAFLDRLMENPSKRAVDELYGFLEACDLPVTPDGYFLAYKRVRSDYKDIHSGTFDNSVGAVCEMPRNRVDEDKDQTCSAGLHFCSYSYLPHFGSDRAHTDRVMVVKIDPADVVAIPSDYNNAKGRTCRYEVVSEMEGWKAEQLPSWYTEDFEDDEDEENFENDWFLDPEDDDIENPFYLDTDDDPDEVDDPVPVSGQKLSVDEVIDIRAMLDDGGYTLREIADRFGIHRRTVARIRDREIWKDV